MTLANASEPPRETSGRRPLWIAMTVAAVAVAIVAFLVLGGRSNPSSERRQRGGAIEATTPAQDAADAVDATPAVDAAGPGAFGGPGSAADGTIGGLEAGQQQQVVAERSRPRARRVPRRQAEQNTPAEPPAYRAIGPTADEPTPPQT